jgi:predicted small metal-binding protein
MGRSERAPPDGGPARTPHSYTTPFEAPVKQFSCGDVVPTCTRTFVAPTDEEILAAVAAHARADHGLTEIPAHLVDEVRRRIRSDA